MSTARIGTGASHGMGGLTSGGHDNAGLRDIGQRGKPDATLQAMLMEQGKTHSADMPAISSNLRPGAIGEVRPHKQLDRRVQSPFSQMIHEKANASVQGLSEADRIVLANPKPPRGNFRVAVHDTAKQIVELLLHLLSEARMHLSVISSRMIKMPCCNGRESPRQERHRTSARSWICRIVEEDRCRFPSPREMCLETSVMVMITTSATPNRITATFRG